MLAININWSACSVTYFAWWLLFLFKMTDCKLEVQNSSSNKDLSCCVRRRNQWFVYSASLDPGLSKSQSSVQVGNRQITKKLLDTQVAIPSREAELSLGRGFAFWNVLPYTKERSKRGQDHKEMKRHQLRLFPVWNHNSF